MYLKVWLSPDRQTVVYGKYLPALSLFAAVLINRFIGEVLVMTTSTSLMSDMGHKQRCMVLIVALVMVLLMTIVGLAAIRGSNMQELMAGNMRDRNLAFQAAEAGLRAGESQVRPEILVLPVFDGTEEGMQPDLNAPGGLAPSIFWATDDWAVANSSVLTAMGLDLASGSQPRYVVEKLVVPVTAAAAAEGSAIDVASLDAFEEAEFFRVTSRGVGGTTDTDVLVQSVYKR
jgi:type IV pilus assembly protein PilX